jgi:hypothetical protein
MIGWLVLNKSERIRKEAVVAYSRYPGIYRKVKGKPLKILGVQAAIRAEHIPKASIERYRHSNILSFETMTWEILYGSEY